MQNYPMTMGQDDVFVNAIADKIVDVLTPTVKDLTVKAMEASEPTIRKVVKEDVIPWMMVAVVAGILGGALVGSYMATRR